VLFATHPHSALPATQLIISSITVAFLTHRFAKSTVTMSLDKLATLVYNHALPVGSRPPTAQLAFQGTYFTFPTLALSPARTGSIEAITIVQHVRPNVPPVSAYLIIA
jgi:hypothetical protein